MPPLGANASALFCCGAECGIAAAGTASAGVEHWSVVNGSPSVVTSGPPMRSTRAFRIDPAATTEYLQHAFATQIASPATTVARFYVWFDTLPSADCSIFNARDGAGAVDLGGLRFVASDSTLRARALTTNAASGITVTTGRWYRIDVKVVANTTTTCDVQVNGVALTQASAAGSARPSTNFQIGVYGANATADFYVDDICISGTSANYPIGPGMVLGVYPNADGTHSVSASSDFGKGAGGATAVNQSDTDCWQSLANPLSTSIATNFLADIAGLSGEYLEIRFPIPPPLRSVASLNDVGYYLNGLMLVVATHSATTTANNLTITPRDASGALSGGALAADLSETTITVPIKMYILDSTGLIGINEYTLSDLRIRFSSTDVSPDVYLDGVMFEADIVAPSWQLPPRSKVRRSQALLMQGRF